MVWRTTPAIPRPASSAVPRCPTIAASESRNSGSATSARNAGTARRRISRSVVLHRRSVTTRQALVTMTCDASESSGGPYRTTCVQPGRTCGKCRPDVLHVDKPTGDSHMSRRWTAGSAKIFLHSRDITFAQVRGRVVGDDSTSVHRLRPQPVHNIVACRPRACAGYPQRLWITRRSGVAGRRRGRRTVARCGTRAPDDAPTTGPAPDRSPGPVSSGCRWSSLPSATADSGVGSGSGHGRRAARNEGAPVSIADQDLGHDSGPATPSTTGATGRRPTSPATRPGGPATARRPRTTRPSSSVLGVDAASPRTRSPTSPRRCAASTSTVPRTR